MNATPSLSRQLGVEDALRAFQPGIVVFERFQLTRYLGRSVVNTLWLASDTQSGRQVALKLLPKLVLCDQAGLNHLRSAVQDAQRLVHPGIVRTHELLEDDHWAAVVTEAVQGDSLDQLRADQDSGILEPNQLRGALGQIIEALTYATGDAGVLHKKITPANILVDHSGTVRITDFGIARVISDCLQRATRHVGTSGEILYLSPQQLDGEGATESDDIYALGATLYELLTSKPPFFHGDIIWQIRNEMPPSLTDRRKELGIVAGPIPKAWEKIVAACLAKELQDRPADFASVAGKEIAAPAPFPIAIPAQSSAPAAQPPEPAAGEEVAASPEPAPVETTPVVPIVPIVPSIQTSAAGDMAAPVVHAASEKEEAPSQSISPSSEDAAPSIPEPVATKAPVASAPVAQLPPAIPAPVAASTAPGAGLRPDFVPFQAPQEDEEIPESPRRSLPIGAIAAAMAALALIGGGFYFLNNRPQDDVATAGQVVEPAGEVDSRDASTPEVVANPEPERVADVEARTAPAEVPVVEAPAVAAIDPSLSDYERALAEAQAAAKFAAEQAERAEALRKAAEEKARLAAEARAAEEARIAEIREAAKTMETSAAEAEKTAEELTAAYEAIKAEAEKTEADAAAKVAAAKEARTTSETRIAEVETIAEKIKQLEAQLAPLKEQQESLTSTLDETRQLAEAKAADATKARELAEQSEKEMLAQESAYKQALADAAEARRLAQEKARELQQLEEQFATHYPAPRPVPSASATPAPEAMADQVIQGAESDTLGDETRPVKAPKLPDPEPRSNQAAAEGVIENPLGMRFVPVGPVHFSVYETRLQDFKKFVSETNHTSFGSWQNPGFKQGDDHPVVSVTWTDAMAFCKWLTERDRKAGIINADQVYRLPTDEEWSLAVGLPQEEGTTAEARDMGITNVYPWGTNWPPPATAGNYTGQEAKSDAAINGMDDGFMWTAPVGKFEPNSLGLYDMGGNAWEWVMDWWNKDQKARVLRGASWYNGGLKLSLLSSCRICSDPKSTTDNYGFRVVLAHSPEGTAQR